LILDNNQAFLLDALGRRAEAQALVRANVARFTGPDGRPGLLANIPLIPCGIFQADSGETAGGYDTLTRAINGARRLGLFDVLAGPATFQLQFVLADLGRLDDALALNAETQARARRVGLTVVADQLEALAAWLALGHGRPERAAAWVQAHPLDETTRGRLDRSVLVLLHARMLAALGAGGSALEWLEPRLARAAHVGQRTLWVREGLEVVLIRLTLGRRREAEQLLGDLVAAGAEMNYRQVFRRNVSGLAQVLPAVRSRAPAFVDSVLTPAAPATSRLIEPLGERELEIVRLLAAGLSNGEIAERLFLAPATIKWYLSQTYGKLGVRRRTEAVATARDLGLI
jgi:LuxR family maltose regulon positive regulatory protein